jgi:phosphinothricin acetyltransferase
MEALSSFCRSRAPPEIASGFVMDGIVRYATDADAAGVIAIFNHYAATGFAAYSEAPAPVGFYEALRGGTYAFRVVEDAGTVVGFGSVRPLLPFPAFRGAALLSYFVAPGYAGRGLGTRLLDRLAADSKGRGCTTLVANVSSRNAASLAFHAARGFAEVGRLRSVGVKFGEPFDLVWLQRDL